MRVVLADQRYFVAQSERDLWTIALRLLNERRMIEPRDTKLYALIESVTDEQDGETAVQIARSVLDFHIFPVETV